MKEAYALQLSQRDTSYRIQAHNHQIAFHNSHYHKLIFGNKEENFVCNELSQGAYPLVFQKGDTLGRKMAHDTLWRWEIVLITGAQR